MVQEGLGMDKIMDFFTSPDLMCSITILSDMHFHKNICISISPKILKEFLPTLLEASNETDGIDTYPHKHFDL